MSEQTLTPGQGVVIANILPTLSSMPAVLEAHRVRVAKAGQYAQGIIDKVSAAEKITAEMDNDMKTAIIRLDDAVKVMMGERQPFTQMMEQIAGAFIGNEKQLKPYRDTLQTFRNKRAEQVAAEERQRQEEAARTAAKNKEYADIVAFITRNIEQKLAAKKADRKNQLQAAFNDITLANFEAKEQGMRALSHMFPYGKLNEILNYFVPAQKFHTPAEVAAIDKKIRDGYNWDAFMDTYKTELEVFMRDLIDRLPSKREELLEQKRQAEEKERLRLEREAQLAREQELERQRQQANAAEKKRIEAEQDALRKQQEETRRQEAAAQADRDRLAEEQRLREEATQLELERQRQAEEKKAEETAEAARAVSHAGTLFDQVTAAAPLDKAPEARKGYEVTVTGAAGYVELFQFWFMEAGPALWEKDQKKFEAMKFSSLVSFAEKAMLKGKKVESKYIIYKETYSSVNRRDQPKED